MKLVPTHMHWKACKLIQLMDVIVLFILDNNDELTSPNPRISRQVEVVEMVKLVV